MCKPALLASIPYPAPSGFPKALPAHMRCLRNRAHGSLIFCLLISAALHFILLLGASITSPWSAPPSQSAGALQVHLVAGTHSAEATEDQAHHRDEDKKSTPTNQKREANEPSPPQPFAIMPIFGEPEYVPSSRLSVQPAPLTEISVPYPDNQPGIDTRKVVLTLFIDETGVVDEIDLDDEGAPEEFGKEAAAAFKKARFSPGQMSGYPVKSRIRIEVTFDGRGSRG